MVLRFAYTRPDGGMSIVNVAPKEQVERVLGPLTDEEYRSHVIERSIPADATDVHELPDDWQPPDIDRTFRNAWRKKGAVFSVDMAVARAIHRDKMRRAAKREQVTLDVTKDPAIEAAKTPDELKKVWPSILNAPKDV